MAESSQEQVDIHTPFTKQELLQQLARIDEDISLLLSHTGTAIQSLTTPSSNPTSPPPAPGLLTTSPSTLSSLNPEARLATFKSSMNAFMSTLHSVDVRLKRQIWGLEEAGIITLKGTGGGAAGEGGEKGAAAEKAGGQAGIGKTNLEPDGVGKIGGLDVGWLNARSSKVERDMEGELWVGMRKVLEGKEKGDQDGDGDEGGKEDVSMLG